MGCYMNFVSVFPIYRLAEFIFYNHIIFIVYKLVINRSTINIINEHIFIIGGFSYNLRTAFLFDFGKIFLSSCIKAEYPYIRNIFTTIMSSIYFSNVKNNMKYAAADS